jgi:hypothetical protein
MGGLKLARRKPYELDLDTGPVRAGLLLLF